MKIVNKLLVKLHIKKPPEPPVGDNKSSLNLPPPIMERLKEEKLCLEDIIFSFKSDMNSSALYSDTYILFDNNIISNVLNNLTQNNNLSDISIDANMRRIGKITRLEK